VWPAKRTMGETSMSVIPVDEPPGFWKRFAQALDAYLGERTKQAVPEITLRRSRHEIARCRRLMHEATPITTGLGSAGLTQARS
jgi:hypothetical protein